MTSDDESDEPLDPRIQAELEKLNRAAMIINQLEASIDNARATFRQLLTESTQNLDALSKRLGGCIEKAKPYYEAHTHAAEAQILTQRAAARYERAISMQAAAREMVELAELSHASGRKQSGVDSAALEVLNHATIKVMQAESDKLDCEIEHKRLSSIFFEKQNTANLLAKDLRKHINKSKPYYDMMSQVHKSLDDQKAFIQKLEQDAGAAKKMYTKALQRLETISNDIHLLRSQSSVASSLGQRSEGVGSESPTPPAAYSDPELPHPHTKIPGKQGESLLSEECHLDRCTGIVHDSHDHSCVSLTLNPVVSRGSGREQPKVDTEISEKPMQDLTLGSQINNSCNEQPDSALAGAVQPVTRPDCTDGQDSSVSMRAASSDAGQGLTLSQIDILLPDSEGHNGRASSVPSWLGSQELSTIPADLDVPVTSTAGRKTPRERYLLENHRLFTSSLSTHSALRCSLSLDSVVDDGETHLEATIHASMPRRVLPVTKRSSFDQLPPPLAHLQPHYNHQQRVSLSDPEAHAHLAKVLESLLNDEDASLV